jgi:hypothetical protein
VVEKYYYLDIVYGGYDYDDACQGQYPSELNGLKEGKRVRVS